jgi:hypothetical protein
VDFYRFYDRLNIKQIFDLYLITPGYLDGERIGGLLLNIGMRKGSKDRKPRTINIFTVMIENTGEVYKISKHKFWRFMKNLDTLKYRYEIYFNSIDRKGDLLLSNDDL